MTGLKRSGVLLSAVASLVTASAVFMAATERSVLVAERLNAPGFENIEVLGFGRRMPVEAPYLQCTYFTGTALVRVRRELEPCRTFAPACPTTTCSFMVDLRKTS